MGGYAPKRGVSARHATQRGGEWGVGLFNILLCAYVYTFIQLSAYSDFLSHSCTITARMQASQADIML